MNRRRFVAGGGAAAAAWLGAAPEARGDALRLSRSTRGRPRHIIHAVSDGMSAGTLALADQYARRWRGRGLRWMELLGRSGVAQGLVDMRSLNSLVTDSSAAASTWGSGSRIMNSMVNVLPDGRVLSTLYELFGSIGWKRGLVTTTEITHATPAGFAASGVHRDAAETIAQQYLDRGIDVLLGGGQKFFDPAKRKDKRDLPALYAAAGYAVFRTRSELADGKRDRKWLGIFAESHLPFVLDHQGSTELRENVPDLVEMTRAALGKLEHEPHFILQLEAGRVDHSSHNCDGASLVREMLMFDDALQLCLDFQLEHPETLLVITTDHGTGNPALNGMGKAYCSSSTHFEKLGRIQVSMETLHKQIEKMSEWGAVQRAIESATGLAVPESKARALMPFIEKKGEAMYDVLNAIYPQLSLILANETGISFTSGTHTSDYVPLTALGPGADRFRGFLQGGDVFRHYLSLARIDFRNPEAPLCDGTGLSAAEAEFGAACT